MKRLSRRLLLSGTIVGAAPAWGQPPAWRTVRVVLAGPPGGIIDVGGRAIVDALTLELGQAVVLDHRPGAAGMIAAKYVAAAQPDGHTLLLTVSEISAIQFLTPMAFDLDRDLVPVATLGEGSALACVAATMEVRDLPGLVRYALAHEVHYLNPGNGTRQHLIPEQINRTFGTRMVSVPYRGLPPGVADLLAGRIQFGIVSTALALQHISSGALRAIAFLGDQRLTALPDLRTIGEQGFGGMQVRSTLTLFGPKALPAELVQRFNNAVLSAVGAPQTRRQLEAAYIDVELSRPAELAARFAAEQETLGTLVRSLHLQAQ